MLMRWWLLWAGLAAGCPTSSFTVSSGGGIGGQAAFGLPSNDAVSTGRGVNVVLLDGVTHELLSTHTFDTYGDGAASDASMGRQRPAIGSRRGDARLPAVHVHPPAAARAAQLRSAAAGAVQPRSGATD